jgi:hypothetical protein
MGWTVVLMWRASTSPSDEKIKGAGDAQNGIEMLAASASDLRREDQGVEMTAKVSNMQVANPLVSGYPNLMTAAARKAERKARKAKKATGLQRTVKKKGRAKRRSDWVELETV